jgi:ubiquinone/menaquinone biosynthesis C-methylase UbiE
MAIKLSETMNLGGLGLKARARLSWTDGPTGKVIGVDMTPEMVSRARKKFSALFCF